MTSRVIRRGQLYALASMVIWSTNYILGRLLADAVSPVTISTFRAVVACTMMGAWLSLTRGWPRLTPGLIRPFLVAGFLGIFASQYLTYQALHWTFASTATILNAVSPVVSAVLAIAAGLAPFSRELFTGLAVSGLGAALLTVLGAPAGRGVSVDLGAVLIIASTVTWGLYNISVQRLGRTLPPLAVAEGAMLAGLPFLFTALAVEHPPHLLATVRTHLAALVFLAIGPSDRLRLLERRGARLGGRSGDGVQQHAPPVRDRIRRARAPRTCDGRSAPRLGPDHQRNPPGNPRASGDPGWAPSHGAPPRAVRRGRLTIGGAGCAVTEPEQA